MARRSHRVVPFDGCLALDASLDRFAAETAGALSTLPRADADLELYVDREGRRGMLVEPLHGRGDPELYSGLAVELGIVALRVGRGRRGTAGPPLHEESLGFGLAFEPGVFVQASRAMNQVLVARALEAAGRGGRFVELYAGAGNFTVHLARAFERGEAVEGDALAVRFLRENLEAAGGRVAIRRERDSRTAARLAAAPPPDLLLADPPRGGMRALAPVFESAPPSRAVMVSCHPMAAVRDLATMARAGYRLEALWPVDLFPQTHHLELVALLAR
jgi:23S rRNA (uracil1939-C5)-methyltransferase